MSINVEPTPNPRAMKFTVGIPVGGPVTHGEPEGAPDEIAEILSLDSITSVFMTADFVTVSAMDSVDWETTTPAIIDALERLFG